jgi:hypothetical protein
VFECLHLSFLVCLFLAEQKQKKVRLNQIKKELTDLLADSERTKGMGGPSAGVIDLVQS